MYDDARLHSCWSDKNGSVVHWKSHLLGGVRLSGLPRSWSLCMSKATSWMNVLVLTGFIVALCDPHSHHRSRVLHNNATVPPSIPHKRREPNPFPNEYSPTVPSIPGHSPSSKDIRIHLHCDFAASTAAQTSHRRIRRKCRCRDASTTRSLDGIYKNVRY